MPPGCVREELKAPDIAEWGRNELLRAFNCECMSSLRVVAKADAGRCWVWLAARGGLAAWAWLELTLDD